jgi:hypothetical protein
MIANTDKGEENQTDFHNVCIVWLRSCMKKA